MKKHFLNLLFLCIITFAFPAHSDPLTLEALDKRITALETAQEMAKPENAWVITAMQNMFTLAFTNYKSWIDKKAPQYFTEEGRKAYDKILNELGIISELSTNQSVLYVDITIPPIPTSSGRSELPGPDGASAFQNYRVTMNLLFQSGAKIKPLGDLEFEVTVGIKYKELTPVYTIRDIVLLSDKKEHAKTK